MEVGPVRIDDFFFTEFLTISCSAVQHDEDDEAHSGMTKTARDFLKKKFGTISRFYSNITTADTADVNGFSRINSLRKALTALDRGGWERSYHQRIFHVRHRIFPHRIFSHRIFPHRIFPHRIFPHRIGACANVGACASMCRNQVSVSKMGFLRVNSVFSNLFPETHKNSYIRGCHIYRNLF